MSNIYSVNIRFKIHKNNICMCTNNTIVDFFKQIKIHEFTNVYISNYLNFEIDYWNNDTFELKLFIENHNQKDIFNNINSIRWYKDNCAFIYCYEIFINKIDNYQLKSISSNLSNGDSFDKLFENLKI
jgi:hypothetical protein